jgi:hypothetical protein
LRKRRARGNIVMQSCLAGNQGRKAEGSTLMAESGDTVATPKGCVYGGKRYSEGSYLCQSGRLLKCHAGRWEDTGQKCDTASQADPGIKAVLVIAAPEWPHQAPKEGTATPTAFKNSSEGMHCAKKKNPTDLDVTYTDIVPQITIRGTGVSVSFRSTGSATAEGVFLENVSAGDDSFEFRKQGYFTIKPGTYKQQALGQIKLWPDYPGGCVICSVGYDG